MKWLLAAAVGLALLLGTAAASFIAQVLLDPEVDDLDAPIDYYPVQEAA